MSSPQPPVLRAPKAGYDEPLNTPSLCTPVHLSHNLFQPSPAQPQPQPQPQPNAKLDRFCPLLRVSKSTRMWKQQYACVSDLGNVKGERAFPRFSHPSPLLV
ncbi:hypothetical protein VTH06DRAFT_6950 [Thermothelomyces fergusii]